MFNVRRLTIAAVFSALVIGAAYPLIGGTIATPVAAAATTEVASLSLAATHELDSDYAWDEASEIAISLDDTGNSGGDGVTIEGSTVTIDDAGSYRISGLLSDGQLVVDTDDEGLVRLILDGVSITSSSGAAIAILDADKTIVYLADGSENTLVDAAEYAVADPEEDEPNAALFSKDDLTITGSGALTVSANHNDGIASKDGLVIAGGTISVSAVDDGIRGKDYLVVTGGALDIIADGDGLTSDNEEDSDLGYVSIRGGVLDITAGADAIEAVTAVLVSGGDLTLWADDDGIHSEAWLEISGGSIDITGSYEGLEGTQIVISGGATGVVAEDDGLNVSDGNGSGGPAAGEPGDALGQRPGPGGPVEAPIEGLFVEVSGGTLTIDADGDGFESNGIASMSGGTIVISGPTTSREGAIDINGEFLVSGGTLVAAGSVGMVETPSASSEQVTLDLQFGSVVPAGTVVRVQALDGTEIVTVEPTKPFQSVVVSMPELEAGESYEILLEGSVSGDSLGGLYLDAEYSGGISVGTVTAA